MKNILDKNLIFSNIYSNANEIKLASTYLDIGVDIILCEHLSSIKLLLETFKNAYIIPKKPITNIDELLFYNSIGVKMFILEKNDLSDDSLNEIIQLSENLGILIAMNIKNKEELKFIPKNIFMISLNCDSLHDNFLLKLSIPKHIKTILNFEIKSINEAYSAFSLGFSGIFCDDILKKGAGKFINYINLAFKHSKKDNFYCKFFNKLKNDNEIIQIRGNFSIDEVIKVMDLANISMIAFDMENLKELKNILKMLNIINPNIIKAGIIKKDKKIFQIARNLQDIGLLDVLEIESLNIFKNMDSAKFAFYIKNELSCISVMDKNLQNT